MIRTHEVKVYVVKCNLCDRQNRSVADGFNTPEQAYASAVAGGWIITHFGGKNFDLCPDCAVTTEPCS